MLLVCGLILPANFSTAAVLFASRLFLMFIGRIRLKFIFSPIGLGIAGFGLYLLIAKTGNKGRIDTWMARIERFSDEEHKDNYQADQSKIAITPGIVGKFRVIPFSGISCRIPIRISSMRSSLKSTG